LKGSTNIIIIQFRATFPLFGLVVFR